MFVHVYTKFNCLQCIYTRRFDQTSYICIYIYIVGGHKSNLQRSPVNLPMTSFGLWFQFGFLEQFDYPPVSQHSWLDNGLIEAVWTLLKMGIFQPAMLV